MSTTKNPALRNAIERHARVCQHRKVARHILDADCCHEDNAFALFSLPRKLPGLFTVRFTAPADFTAGDIVTLKGREFRVKTRTMDEPAGKLFSAGAVVQCDIDMERNLAFVTMGGEVQIIGGNLGDALPEMDGTASAGSSTNVSREDHVHPTDMSRAPVSLEISTEAPLTGGGDLTASRTIGISLATAATATAAGAAGSVVYAADNDTISRDKAVTPTGLAARLANSPVGMPLMVTFTINNSTGNPTILKSRGIQSVTYVANGVYDITFSTPMEDANYAVAGTAGPGNGRHISLIGTDNSANASADNITNGSKTTTKFRVGLHNGGSTLGIPAVWHMTLIVVP